MSVLTHMCKNTTRTLLNHPACLHYANQSYSTCPIHANISPVPRVIPPGSLTCPLSQVLQLLTTLGHLLYVLSHHTFHLCTKTQRCHYKPPNKELHTNDCKYAKLQILHVHTHGSLHTLFSPITHTGTFPLQRLGYCRCVSLNQET